MVATVTSNSKLPSPNPKRMPLLPSDPGNGTLRRPKAREVTSRYLSVQISSSSNSSSSSSNRSTTSTSNTTGSLPTIPSKRYQSPVVSREGVTTPRNTERAVSVGRRRSVAVEATPSNAERMLVTSMRSLSVAFQGESISIPVSKAKTAGGVGTPGGGLRKGTPERRKLTPASPAKEQRERENSMPSDQQQHRWPGRLRRDNSSFFTQSLDYGAEKTKLNESGAAIKELRKSMIDENGRNKFGVTLNPETYNSEVRMTNKMEIGSNLAIPMNTDTETVSLESIENGSTTQLRGVQRGVVVPARVWQESNRIHRVPDSYSPRSKISGLNRTPGPSKLNGANKVLIENPVSFPRGFSLQGGTKPASPSKLSLMTSTPLRRIDSPLRIRNGAGNVLTDDNSSSMLSMMSFVTDMRRGKLGESRIVDAHDLRLLYNRRLQWRFVNARAEKSLLVQNEMAERSLYNAWISTTKMRRSVKFKRIELQLLRHNLMLYSILKGQEPYLEKWDLIDVDHSNAICGAKEALEASIIRLPVVAGARANLQNVEEAISSAVDVMQTMASSICSLLTKVEQMNFLVCELANLSARENSLLDECKDWLSTRFLPLQVMHCSLRIQLLQLQRLHASSTKEL
ncbi:QWRF motif-containing protein 2-like [Olea europaea var. sylvestris]|uniref:QWRF motif-containing protein 2-like n=1 Tax=Olea europaea var. sylvestris TaxID=158386 RepID=UPI000C1D6402|nr:QWRF motif-containing protein 2-like [Olea europaea var. sylvestris]